MNSEPRVRVTKEVVNMEDFYLLTVKELPTLTSLVENEKLIIQSRAGSGRDGASFFLLRLAIVLLDDVGRIRKFSASLGHDVKLTLDVCEGFLEILKEWLEENNGRGNLLQMTEALRSNGHDNIAELLEQMFVRYSLPMSAKDDEGRDNNVYSLSRDFLKEEPNEVSGSESAEALQNSIILKEVFNKLEPKEQKAFRLVTRDWMKVTFPFWRNLTQLRIEVSGGGSYLVTGERKGIAMSSFMKMVEYRASEYELVKHPFRRYLLSYKDYSYGTNLMAVTTFFSGPVENNFWRLCGPQIEDLQIEDASFEMGKEEKSVYKTCEMLLLDSCPNLKKLKISNSCRKVYGNRRQRMKRGCKKDFLKKQDFAGNLHTLIVGITTDDLEEILFICPKLKTLVLDIEGDITGLIHPTVTAEYIKLETLKINYPCNYNIRAQKFFALREYTELLANHQFNSLSHLTLHGVHLFDARHPPFDLYAALAHCSSTLESLNLTVLVAKRDDLQKERKWFTDLSSFSFPHLTKLKLWFKFDCRQCGEIFGRILFAETNHIKFDFRTLEGMRMLEQLEIKVGRNNVRNPGAQDWICEGDRKSYLPIGVDLNKSDADTILCKNLKKFTYIGWGLNKEDIPLLSSWFPNLTELDAVVKPDAVPLLLDNWNKLGKIDIKTDRLISLRQLRSLKEKRKHLRVIQTIPWIFGQTKRVELKEANGMLYFWEDAFALSM